MHTVSQIFDRFEKEHFPKLKPKTQRAYARVLKLARPTLGKLKADEVRPPHIKEFLEQSTQSVNQRDKHLACLSSAFELAVQQWRWMEVNACKNLPRKRWRPLERNLTDAEYEAVRALAMPRVQQVMDLIVHTGREQREILNLRWSQLRSDWLVFDEGGPAEGKVKVTPSLRRVLDECEEVCGRHEYIITTRRGVPYTGDGFRACWQRIMRKSVKAGGPRFDFFDLRSRFVRRSTAVVPPDLQDLVDRPRELLDVEYKEWLDLTDDVVRANIARHLAALSNYGGGYLVFGISNHREHVENHLGNVSAYSHDTFVGIVKRYLVPVFHCDVFYVRPTEGGDECVIVHVPSHKSEPICSRADGPQDKGRSQGIRRATYYVRAPGPESVPIETPEQWSGIIRRCVKHERELLLSRIGELLQPTSSRSAGTGS